MPTGQQHRTPHAPAVSQTARAEAEGARSNHANLFTRLTPRRIAAIALAAVAVALLAWSFLGGSGSRGTYVAYRDFLALVDRGDVATATIDGETVWFTLAEVEGAGLAGDGEGSDSADDGGSTLAVPTPTTGDAPGEDDPAPASFVDPPLADLLVANAAPYTSNPGSPDFRERLLLAGVDVSEAANADAIFNTVLDLLFFAVFLGGIGFALAKLVSYDRTTFKLVRRTGVTFDDVAGLDALKRELRSVVDVLKNPQAYAGKGIRQVKGIVLEGPPGNGKTLLARALAQEAGVNFIATKGADFQSAFMSLGARKIRMLFRKAARHTPCIVFIDEFDSIGERRSYAGTGIDKENNRIITAMLNEMDGFAARQGILVVAATNSYASLDAALVRPGRFDLKYTVSNPDRAVRLRLVELYTAEKTLSPDLTPARLADAFDGMSCAAIESVLNEAASLALLEQAPAITAAHVAEAVHRVGA